MKMLGLITMVDDQEQPVCEVCGKKMNKGIVAVRLNKFCIKHFEGWYCSTTTSAV